MPQTAIPDPPTTQLSICLFGPIDLQQNSTPLPRPRTRKELWLLALLVLRHRAPLDRKWLAATLWPDSDETQALRNLRRSLNNLREVLGTEAFRLFAPTPRTLSLNLSGASCDVHEFDALIARGETASLEAAVKLYRGPLLEGCLEEWAITERDAREKAYLDALETLAAQAAESKDVEKEARVLRRIVSAAPWRETAQYSLMTTLAASGDRAGAMLVYRQFRLRLHEELQSEPEAETTALYQRLREATRLPARQKTRDTGATELAPTETIRHLPRPLSGLVGRKQELEEITAHLLRTRLLTLTGVGGVGKTRLAIATAERTLPDSPEGVWFVDLAPLVEARFVEIAVATKMGLREDPKRPLIETLTDYLAPRRLLLVLDNCEHLLPGCAQFVNRLLQGCPHLRILATSRQTLGVRGEIAWRVPSLSLPPANGGGATHERLPPLTLSLLESDAARLFLERAMEASPVFALTDRNAGAVAQICRRLDGIPLAIELAAVRVKVLSVEQIARRLDRAFTLLTGGSASELPRHQTLRAMVDGSYALLSKTERALLNRLSVFAGGWTLEAAETVCAGNGIEEEQVLELLSGLADKSLVVVEKETDGAVRFRLLDTLRQYGEEKLQEAAGTERVRQKHSDYFLALSEEARPELVGPRQGVWLERLDIEHDNLRAALTYSEQRDGLRALHFAASLQRFWEIRSYIREGLARFTALLNRPDAQVPTLERAGALNGAGVLAFVQSDFAAADTYHQESLAIFRNLGNEAGIAASLGNLVNVVSRQGNYPLAFAFQEEALSLVRKQGNREREAAALNGLGLLNMEQGDFERAHVLFEESLAISRFLGNSQMIALTLTNLGITHVQRVEWKNAVVEEETYRKAMDCYQEALEIQRTLGEQTGIARTLSNIGNLALSTGDYGVARPASMDCLTLYHRLNNRHGVAYSIKLLGIMALQQNQWKRAAILFGVEHALRQAIGAPYTERQQAQREQMLEELRAGYGTEALKADSCIGERLPLEQSIAYALSESEEPGEVERKAKC